MFDNRYLYASARTRVLETQLLDQTIFERMLMSSSAEDAFKILSETVYSAWMPEISGFREFDKLLFLETLKTKTYLESISPEKALTNLFFLKYDVHNIKVFLKNTRLKAPREDLYLEAGTIPLLQLKEMLRTGELTDLPPEIGYEIKRLIKTLGENGSPRQIDLWMDKGLYSALVMLSKKSKSQFLEDLIATQIDLINLKTFIRLKVSGEGRDVLQDALIENGYLSPRFYEDNFDETLNSLPAKVMIYGYDQLLKLALEDYAVTKQLVKYEKLAEDLQFEKVKQAKYIAFGFEVLAAYWLAKENEAKLIRLIMTGKINHISVEAIRERLGSAYV